MSKKSMFALSLGLSLLFLVLSVVAAKLSYAHSESKAWLFWSLAGVAYLWGFGWGLRTLRKAQQDRLPFLSILFFLVSFFGLAWWESFNEKKAFLGLAEDQITRMLPLAYLRTASHHALQFAVLFGLFGFGITTFFLARRLARKDPPSPNDHQDTSPQAAVWSLGLGVGGMLLFSVGGWFAAMGQRQCFVGLSNASPDQKSLLRSLLKDGLQMYHSASLVWWVGGALALLGFGMAVMHRHTRQNALAGLTCLALALLGPWFLERNAAHLRHQTNADGASLRHFPNLQLPAVALEPAPSRHSPNTAQNTQKTLHLHTALLEAYAPTASGTNWTILDANNQSHSLKPLPTVPKTEIIPHRFAPLLLPAKKATTLTHKPETSALMLPCESWSSRERQWSLQRSNPSIRYNGSCCVAPKQRPQLAFDRRLPWAKIHPHLSKRAQQNQCAFLIASTHTHQDAQSPRFPAWLFGRSPAHAFGVFAWPSKQEIPSWKGGTWLRLRHSPSALHEGSAPLSTQQARQRLDSWRKQCGTRCGVTLSADPQTSWQDLLQTYLTLHQAWVDAPYVPGPFLLVY